MPDYRLAQEDQTIRGANHLRQDQQEILAAEGYKVVCNVFNADRADATLLYYPQLVTRRITRNSRSQPFQYLARR